jgi:hypothetical protein
VIKGLVTVKTNRLLILMEALAAASENRLEKAIDVHNSLASVGQAESSIMDDLTASLGGLKELGEKLAEANGELSAIGKKTNQAHTFLSELLTPPESSPDLSPGPVLKSVFETTQELIAGYLNAAVSRERTNVSVIDILNIEEQLLALMEEMDNRNLYPESEESENARSVLLSQHNERLEKLQDVIQSLRQ